MGKDKEETFKEQQAVFRRVRQAEPLTLMICVIRNTLTAEAQVLEEALGRLGLSPRERGSIYAEISKRREVLEADLDQPGAYERYLAQAKLLGLFKKLPTREAGAR